MERKLAAILIADVVGYSQLSQRDEEGTRARFRAHLDRVFRPRIGEHHGRLVKTMGDGVLAEFPSVVNALRCAIAIQQHRLEENAEDAHRLQFRIGINLGDVIVEDSDVHGDGVNIAHRLQSLAEPDGIVISGTAYDQVRNKVDAMFTSLGEQQIKNIAEPIRVFRIELANHASKHARAHLLGPGKPSIAVLPFTNMSGDADQEYFSDGITEDIITELSHFREFFVIARNTTFTYKGQAVRIDRVCRELGVRYILEGSVRKSGQRIRVTAQLIDGGTGAHLWASRFDRDLDDIFLLQDEITRAIVTAVAPETMGAELKRSQWKRVEDLNAWERVLRARWHMNRLCQEDNEIAMRLLRKAIADAPEMAEAHSTLAICHINAMLHVWRRDTDATIRAAMAAAQQAVALEGNDANALAVLGRCSLFSRRFEEAFECLNRAINLNPNLADAYGTLAAAHAVSGEYAAACAAIDKALALSPRDPSKVFWFAGKGIGAYISGRYDECVEIARNNLREHPGFASSLRQLAAALGQLGRTDEAAAALTQLLERMPGLTIAQVRRMVPVRYAEDQERWLDGLRKAGLPE